MLVILPRNCCRLLWCSQVNEKPQDVTGEGFANLAGLLRRWKGSICLLLLHIALPLLHIPPEMSDKCNQYHEPWISHCTIHIKANFQHGSQVIILVHPWSSTKWFFSWDLVLRFSGNQKNVQFNKIPVAICTCSSTTVATCGPNWKNPWKIIQDSRCPFSLQIVVFIRALVIWIWIKQNKWMLTSWILVKICPNFALSALDLLQALALSLMPGNKLIGKTKSYEIGEVKLLSLLHKHKQ